jgi:hypothetical protein
MAGLLARLLGAVFGLKTFASTIMMAVLAIIFYNLAVELVQETMNFAVAQINGVDMGQMTSPSISGFAGWFLAQIKFPECVSVIITAVSVKFILRKIPFLRW